MNRGDTNGLATEKPKRGRPRRSTNEEEEKAQHPYLELVSGKPVNSAYMYKLSVKARRIWALLLKIGLAPETYSEMDQVSREYYIREMCQEFFELRLCADYWKLDMWSQRNYPSWAVTHLESKKQKKESKKRQKNTMTASLSDENTGGGLVAALASTNNPPTSTVPTLTATAAANSAPTSTVPTSSLTATAAANTSATSMLASTVPSSTDTQFGLGEDALDSPTNFPTSNEPPSAPPSSSSLSASHGSSNGSADVPSGVSTGNTSDDNGRPSTPSNSTFDDPCNDNDFIRQMEEGAITSASALAAAAAAQSHGTGGNGSPVENEDNIDVPQSQTSGGARKRRAHGADTGAGRQRKRLNAPAVVGSGKTAKNFCMAEWLKTNTNGTKDEFDTYFSTLTEEQLRPFEDAAKDAINSAARDVRNGNQRKRSSTKPTAALLFLNHSLYRSQEKKGGRGKGEE
ncbi:hypothetical protein JOM56_004355 [Amanita muscaria]